MKSPAKDAGVPRVVKAGFMVADAGPEDEAEMRALLGASPMDGLISVALTREPDTRLAAAVEGIRHHTVLVRSADDGELLGMGTRSIRPQYYQGKAVEIGYLSQLRAGRGKVGLKRLRAGYAHLAATHHPDELPFDLTTIVADNAPARVLLERRLPGLPHYERLSEIQTLVLSTRAAWLRPRRYKRHPAIRQARPEDLERIAFFLQRTLRRYAFAPRWTARDLRRRCLGLEIEDFLVLDDGYTLRACGACWDQRGFKQVVIRGYRPWLGVLRPLANVGLGLVGQPQLPAAGATLPLGYASHLAFDADDDSDAAVSLVAALCERAGTRGLEQLVLALPTGHPLLRPLSRQFSPRIYRSVLYAVNWSDAGQAKLPDGNQSLYVEAGLL